MEPTTAPVVTEIVYPYLIAGIALALFGWTLYWTGVHVIGAALGGLVGMSLAYFAVTLLEMPETSSLLMISMGFLLGGVLGLMLMRLIQNYFFFLVGAALGAPGGWKLLTIPVIASQPWASQEMTKIIAVVAGGLLGGILMLVFKRYVIAFVTALVGSAMIAVSVPYKNPALIALPCFFVSLFIQTGLVRWLIPDKGKRSESS